MKAIEILNQQLYDEVLWLDNHTEAIEELEALQNRSCENCKLYKQNTMILNGSSVPYYDCIEIKIRYGTGYVTPTYPPIKKNDFCCNKWEEKYTVPEKG